MSDQELLELKSWGHQLINVLAEKKKITKDEVYALISQRMGRKKRWAHFGNVGAEDAQKIINALLKELKKGRQTGVLSKKAQAKKEWREMKEANARANHSQIKAAIAALPKKPIPFLGRIRLTLKELLTK